MKQDVPPLPGRVPAKRRQMHALPDVHIALWLADGEISPSERRRLAGEKARRKALVPDLSIGLLVGREGATPEQHFVITTLLERLRTEATQIHHPGLASSLHQICKRTGVPVTVHDDGGMREVVRSSQYLIAAPKTADPHAKTPLATLDVWAMVRYAKHRNLAVQVVLPDGGVYTGRDGT